METNESHSAGVPPPASPLAPITNDVVQASTAVQFSKLATANPPLLHKSDDDNFPQGCQFSPDGLCLLTARGHRLELYNTPNIASSNSENENDDNQQQPPWSPVLTYPQGGNSVRCYTWYPSMTSTKPETCCFASVSRDGPVHLFDCYASNDIRATYSPYNRLDELESPKVLTFLQHGQHLLTGGFHTDRMLQIFDVARPGRQALTTLKLGKTKRSKDGQKGIVSAVAASGDDAGVVAVGTVSPGSIYLYDVRTYCQAPVSEIVMAGTRVVGHGKRIRGNKRKRLDISGDNDEDIDDALDFAAAKQHWYHQKAQCGVTQMDFHKDTNFLFSTSRRSNAILQWDLRKLSSSSYCPGVASFDVENDTNQRIEFQVHGNEMYCGGTDGCVRVYDVTTGELAVKNNVGEDVVNGVSVTTNSATGKTILATAIGSRHFPTDEDWENDNPGETAVSGMGVDARESSSLLLFEAT